MKDLAITGNTHAGLKEVYIAGVIVLAAILSNCSYSVVDGVSGAIAVLPEVQGRVDWYEIVDNERWAHWFALRTRHVSPSPLFAPVKIYKTGNIL